MYKSGLVLEGGGLRAIYTSGVLDAFIENDITFPYVIGVSAGSCNGVSYIAKNLHRMRDISLDYSTDERYMGVKSIFKNGEYLNTKWVFGELSYELFPLNYEEYEKANTVFCVVVTNAKTGKTEYMYPKDFRNGCNELIASSAIPIAVKPVKIGNDYYYDGGLTDSIPLKKAFDDGCEKCVVILTQDYNYVKKPMGHDKAIKKALKKFPQTYEKVKDRHIMYNEQRKYVFQEESDGNALVIYPSRPLDVSTLSSDVTKLRDIYNLGYKQGLENIDRVKAYIG